jgi:hypothetical protein
MERDPLRGQLHHLLARDAGARQSVTAKQRFWKTSVGDARDSDVRVWRLGSGAWRPRQELFKRMGARDRGERRDRAENAGTPASSNVLATAMCWSRSRFER